jgi:hypothetical protein
MGMEATLKDEIVAGYGRGWNYIPLRIKIPRIKAWQTKFGPNRASLETVLQWADEGNVGILTGHQFVVIDLDPGAPSLDLPDTVTAITKRGGLHLYYTPPEDPTLIKNWVGKLGKHVDIRTIGGQVVSVGCPGYRWQTDHGPAQGPMSSFPIEQVRELLASPPIAPSLTAPRPATSGKPYAAAALEKEVERLRAASEGTRNNILNEAAFNLGQLVGGGELNEADVVLSLRDTARSWIGNHCTQSEIDQTIRSGITAGKQKPRRAPEPRTVSRVATATIPTAPTGDVTGANTKPRVLVPGAHLSDEGEYIEQGNDTFADQCLSFLPANNLCRRSTIPGRIVGQCGEKRFQAISADGMCILLDEHLWMGKWNTNQRTGEVILKYQNANRSLAAYCIDSAQSHPSVSRLDAITTYPTYLPDWSLAKPGWNANGIYYDATLDIKPETDREVIDAVLDDLITDFPFKEKADRENFIGLLLTPILRPALGGNVPMHLINSPMERTGKSKLAADVFGGVLTGRQLPATQLSDDEKERNNLIASALLKGGTLILLDNVNEFLDSAALAAMLTAEIVEYRLFNRQSLAELPNRLTVVATGNNVKATGEIVKRTIPIHLQPRTDTPEARTDFQHPDLSNHVAGIRALSLAALLGLVENWKAAGIPLGSIRIGGFERWSAVLHGIMTVNGYTDWATNIRDWTRDADPTSADLRSLLDTWHAQHQANPLTAMQAMALAKECGIFPECFCPSTEHGRLMSFTRRVLSKNVDKPAGLYRLHRLGSGNNATYYVRSIDGANGA